jgi:predicted AAA+ superfamily ATPase
MKRKIYDKLIRWKNNPLRKPLLLQGARQVGKTWIVKKFGSQEFDELIYLNFEQDPELAGFFEGNLQAIKIIENLELYFGKKIKPESTLIFFDEIQAVPRALTSMKYFYEQNPEYHLIGAGSLLGVSVGKSTSFPVGKVSFLTLFPMDFDEFLIANGEEILAEKIAGLTEKLPEAIHHKLIDYLKKYLFLGGMPEVIKTYIDTRDFALARKIQNEILEAYQRDFSKYSEKKQVVKTLEFWHSIPYQLAKESKKFKYSDIHKRARSAYYEQTLEWLKNAGLIYPAYQVSVPKIPLSGYSDRSKFKVYLSDTGLLGAMLQISLKNIAFPEKIFSEYNGAFIENFVASQLTANGFKELFYWKSKSDAEVDFLITLNEKIFPLEVKSGSHLRSKSLRSYQSKYQPELSIRISPANYEKAGNFINIPLYEITHIKTIIEKNTN